MTKKIGLYHAATQYRRTRNWEGTKGNPHSRTWRNYRTQPLFPWPTIALKPPFLPPLWGIDISTQPGCYKKSAIRLKTSGVRFGLAPAPALRLLAQRTYLNQSPGRPCPTYHCPSMYAYRYAMLRKKSCDGRVAHTSRCVHRKDAGAAHFHPTSVFGP